ncbi:MAG: PLDc N-terminal domain-containing protein [Bacillota bacterium]
MERKYCEKCGEPLEPHYEVCPNCGNKLQREEKSQTASSSDASRPRPDEEDDTAGWAVLSVFFPVVGVILYVLWKESRPKASRSVGNAAIVGFILHTIVSAFVGTLSL